MSSDINTFVIHHVTIGKNIMEKAILAFNFLYARFKEPSSFASLSAVFMLAGINIGDGSPAAAIMATLSIVSGTLGFFLPDQKK
jgi:hypothetical protein